MAKLWKLGSRSIYASISIFNGVPKVHLRQFIPLEDGTMRATKKGVAFNSDEWDTFISILNDIDLDFRQIQTQQIETEPVLDLNMFHQGRPDHTYSAMPSSN